MNILLVFLIGAITSLYSMEHADPEVDYSQRILRYASYEGHKTPPRLCMPDTVLVIEAYATFGRYEPVTDAINMVDTMLNAAERAPYADVLRKKLYLLVSKIYHDDLTSIRDGSDARREAAKQHALTVFRKHVGNTDDAFPRGPVYDPGARVIENALSASVPDCDAALKFLWGTETVERDELQGLALLRLAYHKNHRSSHYYYEMGRLYAGKVPEGNKPLGLLEPNRRKAHEFLLRAYDNGNSKSYTFHQDLLYQLAESYRIGYVEKNYPIARALYQEARAAAGDDLIFATRVEEALARMDATVCSVQ